MEDYKTKYEKAIEQAKKELQACGSLDCDAARQIFRFFPELKESKDERIRKEIIQFLQLPHPQFVGKRNQEKWIAWLEKQGEQTYFQKQEWTGYDEKAYEIALLDIDKSPSITKNDTIDWLKSLKNRVQPQPKQEWSEEDENMLQKAISTIMYALSIPIGKENDPCFAGSSTISWLKSLKERYTWKPSDRQMKQLGWVAEQNKDNALGKELMTLYQDLKKLREE